jgi:hypothetical protein
MTDLQTAAQQALEFLDAEFGWSPGEAPRIDDLRTALARQEPLAGMSAITISRATALQALAAMDKTLRFMHDEDYVKLNHAIDTFKAALAQQEREQEPVVWTATRLWNRKELWTCPADIERDLLEGYTHPPRRETEQEPVAWAGYDLDGMAEAFSRVIEAHHSSKYPFQNPIDMDAKIALRILRGLIPAMKTYTHPPRREWQGLMEEEIDALFLPSGSVIPFYRAMARVVEQALKERNT